MLGFAKINSDAKPAGGWRAVCLLACLAALFLGGCSQDSPPDPKAAKLKEVVISSLNQWRNRVEPLLLKGKADQLESMIELEYKAAQKAGKPLDYGVAVLSKEGKVIAGRYPPEKGKPVRLAKPGTNFSHYGHFRRVLDDGLSSTCLLYTQDLTMYAVCAPLKQNDEVIGITCVGYPQGDFKKKFDLSDKEFLDLKFGD